MKSLEEIKKIGAETAKTWIDENPETLNDCLKNPTGWDEALINALTDTEIRQLFDATEGEDLFPAYTAYNEGAHEVAQAKTKGEPHAK
jgi:hypothetical protein